jgi:RNA polymerase sigma factor (sigma-70 family)
MSVSRGNPIGDDSLRGLSRESSKESSQFETTSWSKLERVLDEDSNARREALSQLFRIYVKPIYSYLRSCFHLPEDETRERIQDFFLWTLETDFFQKADRRHGSFRGLLKNALKNYSVSEFRKEGRLKRGGGVKIIPLELGALEGVDPMSQEGDPESLLDLQWKQMLLKQAIETLRLAYGSGEKNIEIQVFEAFYVQQRPYLEIAEMLRISVADVGNILFTVRKKLRAAVMDVVAETVSSSEALKRELEELFEG